MWVEDSNISKDNSGNLCKLSSFDCKWELNNLADELKKFLVHSEYKKVVTKAKKELKKDWITAERNWVKNYLSERIYRTAAPYGNDMLLQLKMFWNNKDRWEERASPEKDAAWKMYLWLPLNKKQRDFIGISEYRPSKESWKTQYYYTVPWFEKQFLEMYFDIVENHENTKVVDWMNCTKKWNCFDDGWYSENRILVNNNIFGKFPIYKGSDERWAYISYYDLWDLLPDVKVDSFNAQLIAGKPIEFYNRIYFNPETKKRIFPK